MTTKIPQSLYWELKRVGDFRMKQAMDTSDDKSYFTTMEGTLLMTVDSNGTAYDKDGAYMGEFSLIAPGYKHWKFTAKNGNVIETSEWLLYERVEPMIVAQLFTKERVGS